MASSIVLVNNTPLATTGTTGFNAGASSTITISLASVVGVNSWAISATSADDITSANGNLVAINNSKTNIGSTGLGPYTFDMPSLVAVDGYDQGAGIQFTSVVNNQPNTVSTFGVWVLNPNGTRLFFGNESNESDATVGNAAQLNQIMRIVSSGGGGGGSFVPGGDLSGTVTDQTVIGLYTNPLASTSPTQSCVPVWDNALSHYSIRELTADDIGAGFSITGFSGGSTVEIGATVTNPSFTASYNMTPNSAQITNTDGTDSPLTLSNPYTSGTVVGSFSHNLQSSVVFTLTAVSTSTKTATSDINFYPRSFGGVGSAGATSSVTAGTNTAILSTGDILSSLGLFSSDTGQTFGPFSPVNQSIYLLLTGGSHMFKDPVTGFGFAFNSPTPVSFVNQHSQTVSMYLYQSTYLLDASFSVEVVS